MKNISKKIILLILITIEYIHKLLIIKNNFSYYELIATIILIILFIKILKNIK